MSTAGEIALGVIAAATLAIAIAQVGIVLLAGRLAKRVEQLSDQFEREIQPIFGHLNTIGRDVSRAAALATLQVERADKLFADFAVRVDQAMNTVQASLSTPAREGRALLSAFRAAFQVLRELRQSGRGRQTRSEDEDALFI